MVGAFAQSLVGERGSILRLIGRGSFGLGRGRGRRGWTWRGRWRLLAMALEFLDM